MQSRVAYADEVERAGTKVAAAETEAHREHLSSVPTSATGLQGKSMTHAMEPVADPAPLDGEQRSRTRSIPRTCPPTASRRPRSSWPMSAPKPTTVSAAVDGISEAPAAAMIASPGMPREHGITRTSLKW
jgi:hypothetical protein